MAIKRANWSAGRIVTLEHSSNVLADNALGDPSDRILAVWLPPQYDAGKGRGRGRRFPVLFDLVGYTGSGLSHTSWRSFAENVPEQAARLVHEKKLAPCIIVFPDCFTALGGNQYINSSAIGRYADYLTKELIPFVDNEFRTHADRDHRGCFGKSSGGYGAIIHGMRYARYWGAIAATPAMRISTLCIVPIGRTRSTSLRNFGAASGRPAGSALRSRSKALPLASMMAACDAFSRRFGANPTRAVPKCIAS
jgi:enterochelin esterase-like enzyme